MGYVLSDGCLNPPASAEVVAALSDVLGVHLPSDYLDFLLSHNGAEGFVHDDYFVFWQAEELLSFNRDYEVEKYAPGVLLFGSDGGGEGYGFDTSASGLPIVRIPFIGMSRQHAITVAKKFADLFQKP